MTTLSTPARSSTPPLIAVLCSVPMLAEAVGSVLDFAEVRSFATGEDVAGLLRWLKPDALVVDTEEVAREAAPFAEAHTMPILRISVRDQALHLLRDGVWEHVGDGENATPEAIRNIIAGSLFAREVVR